LNFVYKMEKNNPRKNAVLKNFWFESEKEYRQLTDALDSGDNDKVLDLIYEIYKRGDL